MMLSLTITPVTIKGLAVGLLYLVYRALLPKPIPGKPCDERFANSILGDIPDLLRWQLKHQEVFPCMVEKCRRLKSPIMQVFARVGGKPWVVMVDARE